MTHEILAAGKDCVGEKALLEAQEATKGLGSSLLKVADLCRFLSDRKQNGGLSGKLIHVNESYQTWGDKAQVLNESEWGLLQLVHH